MARLARSPQAHRIADDGDFNEQLYRAIRQAPWVMTSIALHAVLILAFLLFSSSPEAVADATEHLRIAPVVEQPLDEELPEDDEPTEPVHATDVPVAEPFIPDVQEVADTPETDNDLESDQTLGDGDGISNAPFAGPATNAVVGIGGGGGGSRLGIGGRRDRRTRGGAVPRVTEDAVEHALRWLAAHQSPDGGWECGGFDRWCDGKPAEEGKRPDGLGMPTYDVGVTGLALCAFLGAGYSSRGDHPFAKVVRRGLAYLKNAQDAEGCFGPRASQHYIYNHATAALAMVEAYGMTASPLYKASAQKALDFISLARNPYFAWRYGVKPGDNDTSVTGWMMMALKSAKLVNEDEVGRGRHGAFVIDEEAFEGIRAWVDKMTDKASGRVGYVTVGSGPARPQDLVDRFPVDRSEAMTAAGVLARIFTGEDPRKSEMIQKGAALMTALPPTWNTADGSIDMYYWYYATLAMFQVGGEPWTRWNKAMQTSMVSSQRMDGDYCQHKGSWDPIDPWGGFGGRVYSTALLAMCLEVYYRYDRVAGTR
jgi:hypothetical protein